MWSFDAPFAMAPPPSSIVKRTHYARCCLCQVFNRRSHAHQCRRRIRSPHASLKKNQLCDERARCARAARMENAVAITGVPCGRIETPAFIYVGELRPGGLGLLKATVDGKATVAFFAHPSAHAFEPLAGLSVTRQANRDLLYADSERNVVACWFAESGNRYEGQGDAMELSGLGLYTSHEGQTHSGSFVRGQAHGSGIQQDGRRRSILGDFAAGKANGYATCFYAVSNDSYFGEVRDGQRHGLGVFMTASSVQAGLWRHDQLLDASVDASDARAAGKAAMKRASDQTKELRQVLRDAETMRAAVVRLAARASALVHRIHHELDIGPSLIDDLIVVRYLRPPREGRASSRDGLEAAQASLARALAARQQHGAPVSAQDAEPRRQRDEPENLSPAQRELFLRTLK